MLCENIHEMCVITCISLLTYSQSKTLQRQYIYNFLPISLKVQYVRIDLLSNSNKQVAVCIFGVTADCCRYCRLASLLS